MTPEVGQRFGPYEILSRLGGGAMGLVFRAWDSRLHREVAIKLLHDTYEMPGMRQRFLQEARAASALNHPHICTIFDIGEQDGDPYLVMEVLEGETLKEKIFRGALSTEEIVQYGQEIADALSAAHAKGIVHRDIKPANIFLVDKPNGRKQAKVLDFGLAKIGLATRGGRASRALDLTLAGATVGTLSYMSPEQARGLDLDGRSDLFSLGVVMYEMATRQVPFQGATSALIYVQLLNNNPEPLHDWNDSIPKELERIILKLLTKERDGRYQTATELLEALQRMPTKQGGGWLRKANSAVPLVRAADPVARIKRPVRTSSDPKMPIPTQTNAPTAVTSASSEQNMLIRPVARIPPKEAAAPVAPRKEEVAPKEEASVREPVSYPVSPKRAEVQRAATQAEPAEVVIPARSRSGATQFEFDVAELTAAAVLTQEKLAEEEAARLEQEEQEREERKRRWRMWLGFAAALIVVAGLVAYFTIGNGRLTPVLLKPGEPLLLTVIQNRTGDKSLDHAVMEGLELALRESQYLSVRGGETYRAGLRQGEAEEPPGSTVPNRRVAQKVGAKAYLYGEITGTGAPYTIHVDVLDAGTNDKLATIEQTANGKQDLAAAISRLANSLRSSLGESDREIVRRSVPLDREATANIDALGEFADGEGALQVGRYTDAMAAYQRATAIDPKFAQAHIQLAWLYALEKAEVAAADEAGLAAGSADGASDRVKLLAQFCDEMIASGDYNRAAGIMRQFRELYPRDMDGLMGTARVLRAQGQMPEALQAAQQAYGENPYRGVAYLEAETAMTALDRWQGALQLQAQAQRLGVLRGRTIAAAYLSDDQDAFEKQTSGIKTASTTTKDADGEQVTFGGFSEYGLALDNNGELALGGAFWRTAAGEAAKVASLKSTEAYLLAQSALDRALTGECGQASGFADSARALPMGLVAKFDAGMAMALCGDREGAEKIEQDLQASYPHSSAVTGYYLADLKASVALHDRDSKTALSSLAEAASYDQISLTPYLRGLAHLQGGSSSLAIADFQTIVDHRGAAFIAGSNVYPMAQAGLAKAYATIGDKVNSKAADERFLELWKHADKGQAATAQAVVHSSAR